VSPRVGALKRIGVLHYFFIKPCNFVNYIFIIDFKYKSIVDLLW
jgi:hypothetical protein